MSTAVIQPFSAAGALTVPTSKSVLHRQLIAAALSDGDTEIICRTVSEDIKATIRCLTALGAKIRITADGLSISPITGRPSDAMPELDCGESGSTLRFLLPVSAALGGAHFMGSGRLPERPISELERELEKHGSGFTSRKLPLTVSGALSAGNYCLPGNVSSQYFTGLMLAAPLIGETWIRIDGPLESANYVKMTADVLKDFGIMAELTPDAIHIPGGQYYKSPKKLFAEADWSAAAFPLCLGVLGNKVTIHGISEDSVQGDREILNILKRSGGVVRVSADTAEAENSRLSSIHVDVSGIPDLVPVMAATCMHAQGVSEFSHAGRLRLKESDRLYTTCSMVNALGGHAWIEADSLFVEGRADCPGGIVDGAGDHRIVMAAVAGASACRGESRILGSEAVSKSWPSFFKDIKALGGKIDVLNVR